MNLKTVTIVAAILMTLSFILGAANIISIYNNGSIEMPVLVIMALKRVIPEVGVAVFLFVLYSKQK